MRRWAALCLLPVLAFVLGCAGPARAAKDELVIGMTQFPATFHPSIDSMLAKVYVLGMTRRPFTAYDADWELVCMLCVELPTIENGGATVEPLPDGREGEGIAVTYTIRPDAVWGDGNPITTADVLFTIEVGKHPESGVTSGELYRRILDVEVHDERRFTLHFDRVTFAYNAINNLEVLPAHLDRPIFVENPREYRHRTLYDTDSTNPGLWYGPYRVARVQPGAQIVLEKNPSWWGAEPGFERIVVRVLENTAALEANLLSGSIDYIAGELGLTLDQALALEKRHGDRFDFVYKPGLIYEHVDLNLDNPILTDLRVRRALLHALDREAIDERLFAGRQPPAIGSINPLDWVYDPDVAKYPYDPDKAKALLDEAGWKFQGGVRRNAAGEPLTLEIMTTAGNRSRELVQQVLVSQWKAVGIDARARNQPARVFFGETVTKRQFPHMAMFAWVSAPESVPRTTLHSSMIPTEANNWSGQNSSGFHDERVDALIDRIEVELDRDKRKAMWSELQRLYAELLPALPLYFRANPYVIPKWLKGLRPTGHQDPSTLWVEDWRAQ